MSPLGALVRESVPHQCTCVFVTQTPRPARMTLEMAENDVLSEVGSKVISAIGESLFS